MLLHSDNYVCPLDEVSGYWSVGIVVGASAQGRYVRMVCEHLMSCWASEPVLAADKENIHRICDVRLPGFIGDWSQLFSFQWGRILGEPLFEFIDHRAKPGPASAVYLTTLNVIQPLDQ